MAVAAANLAWAQALAAACLDGGGVRHVVVSPGSRSTPLVLAFDADARAALHVMLDERAASFLALGMARASGRPAVLVCTSGSAPAHYLPAVLEADAALTPLIVLSADRPAELHHCGAPQTVDQLHLFGTHVRFFASLTTPTPEGSPRPWQVVMAQALHAATGQRPGPVHLNVPFAEPLWEPDLPVSHAVHAPAPVIVGGAVRLPGSVLEKTAERLAQAGRGAVVLGPNAADPEAAVALGARLGWPVLAEPAAQCRFGAVAMKPHVLHAADAVLRASGFAAAHGAACVLRFGATPTSKVLNRWLGAQPQVIAVDAAGRYLDPTWRADTLLAAPDGSLCRDLARLLPDAPRPDSLAWCGAWQRADAAARQALAPCVAEGFWSGTVAHTVATTLPDGALLHLGNSLPIRDMDAFAPPTPHAVRVLCSRGTNGIDGTLSTLLGEALASPGRPTVGILGDLAFLHDVGALQAARQLAVTATAVVVNNAGGGIFDTLPIAQHPSAYERYFRTPQAADIDALCRAAHVACTTVGDARSLGAALQRSFAAPGLSVIEARVTPHRAPHEHAFATAAAAVEAATRAC